MYERDPEVEPHARRIRFDMRWLPVFRRCVAQRKGSESFIPVPANMGEAEKGLDRPEHAKCRGCDKYNFTRASPCWSAASLVLQLWQSHTSLALPSIHRSRERTHTKWRLWRLAKIGAVGRKRRQTLNSQFL